MSTYKLSIEVSCPDASLVPARAANDQAALPLAKALTIVGSGTGVHVCLQTRTVEEFHAVILNADGHVYVRELGTLGGVLVNGQRIRDAVLRDRDEVQFGKVMFHIDRVIATHAEGDMSRVEAAELRVGSNVHWLSGRVMLIGRGPRCDLRLDDDLCSDKHAIVYAADGTWHVRILTPGPGTLLNERSVRRATLRDGDVLMIGRTELVYRLGHSKPTPVSKRQATVIAPALPLPRSLEPASAPAPEFAPAPAPAVSKVAEYPAAVLEKRAETVTPATDASPASSDGSSFFRGWGPVATAMATAHELEPDDAEAIVEPTLRPAPKRWWIAGAIIGAIVIVAASATFWLFT